jgi:hypothetical protein
MGMMALPGVEGEERYLVRMRWRRSRRRASIEDSSSRFSRPEYWLPVGG